MQPCNRRDFLLRVAAGACAVAAAGLATADEAKGKLAEDDAYAKSMGFRLDTTSVDRVKYPKHTVDQNCSKCQLFKGNEGHPEGPCSFFGNRIVPATGWCRNFKAKTA